MNRIFTLLIVVNIAGLSLPAFAAVVDERLASYQTAGAGPFTEPAGQRMWQKKVVDPKSGQPRSCATCHGQNLHAAGKHARTGKVIKAMNPSVNPERLGDAKKIRKWFKRNCKWTWGRECTPQEKGDFLTFIQGQ